MEYRKLVFYLENMCVNNSPWTLYMRSISEPHAIQPGLELGLIKLDHCALPTVESQDVRCGVERAEHHRQPAVLADMTDRLGTGTRGIDVCDLVGVNDGEGGRWHPLGGHVDVYSRGGRGGYEVQGLFKGPVCEVRRNGVVKLDHLCVIGLLDEKG